MVWSWHMVVEVTVATADPADRSCDALVRGQLTSISRDLSVVRNLVISWNLRGGTSGVACWVFLLLECQLQGATRKGLSWKYLWGPTVLPPGGAKLFSANWSYGCSGITWGLPGWREYWPQRPPYEMDVLWPILDILVLSDSSHHQLFPEGWEDWLAYLLIQWGSWQGPPTLPLIWQG